MSDFDNDMNSGREGGASSGGDSAGNNGWQQSGSNTYPPKPPEHYDPYGNTYPPTHADVNNTGKNAEGGYRGYTGPQYQRPRQQYNSFQYNPQTGWQQNGRPGGQQREYEWNFQDYEQLDRRSKAGQKKKNKGLVVFAVSLVGVLVISLFGITGYSLLNGIGDGGAQGSPVSQDGVSPSAPEGGAEVSDPQIELASKPQISETLPVGGKMSIPQIARQVSPSVVGVSAYHQDSRFYEPISVGSGIVMTEDGFIITNAHVVTGGTNFKVQLHDSTPYDARLIGSDVTTDLAVLKIDVANLPPAVFGDSDQVEVGETVIAIGNPSGIELAGSVTMGIISAVNRQVITETTSFNYIQTDAAINPGNSGGALVNEYGQVIGINSSKIVAPGYEGIGFAIPITDAKPILDDIITNGRVTGRVMIGFTPDPVTEADARKYGIPMGLEIRDIDPRSDLKGKDVQLGDILIEINDIRVYTLPDVEGILKEFKVGDTVKLKLYRRISTVQSTEVEVEVVLIEK